MLRKRFHEHDLEESAGVSMEVYVGPFMGVPGCSEFRVDVDGVERAAYMGPNDTIEILTALVMSCGEARTLGGLPRNVRVAMASLLLGEEGEE